MGWTGTMLILPAARAAQTGRAISYLFDGDAQQLDHILATPGLLARARHGSVHVNSQHPTDDRSTDHDPQLAVLALGARPAPQPEVAAVDVAAADDPGTANAAGHGADAWVAARQPTLDHALPLA